ncbi:MAG TPA: response regulator [Candidatus Angelobacter sp.]|nr:response regulator [Candidatus Angelobacter sp.]
MKPLTVLVVDDDLLSRMVLQRSVVQWGYHAVTAVDGEAACEVLQNREIDICLMDWNMPKMSGVEVCRWLRTRSGQQPYVVLITTNDQPEHTQEGYEAGADDYLTKPCDMKYLRRRLATVAEKLQNLAYPQSETPQESVAGMNPLDIYLSDLRLMRGKS